ncbi:MAG: general secretion pathway protein GspB [Gammaproteobacteria bacterium]
MSFILDALQRAQKAHDQSTVEAAPILADQVPEAPANLRVRVIWLALALLGAGIIALGAWWMGRESASPPATRPAPVIADRAPVTQAPTPRAADRAPVRSLDGEVARAQPRPTPQPAAPKAPQTSDAEIQAAVDAGATLIKPRPRPGRAVDVTVTQGTSTPAAATTAPAPAQALPQYESLLLNGKINLPNLKMDMHVFNRQPAKRFVFVNFKKFREGDDLDDNTIIEEITDDGAVLNHNGQRFLLRPN